MEDDIDIYEDLPSFDTKECEKYKEEIKELSQKCNNFQQEIAEFKLKVAELLESNKTLSVNLSSMLKTAKAEICRKDRMIAELRQQLDNVTFRRSGYIKLKTKNSTEKSERNERYSPIVRLEAPPVRNQPASHQKPDIEIEDSEQKYEPEKIASTLFGERLRKKILIEQEMERIQKEEAKRAALENNATVVEADIAEVKANGTASNKVKKEPQKVSNSLPDEAVLPGKSSAPSSNGSSLQSYKEEDRSLCERRELDNKLAGKRMNKSVVYPEQKRRKIEDERHQSDDMRHYNGNVKNQGRFNFESNDSSILRNCTKHVNHRRTNNNREEFERTREAHSERSKSNYRSRSRTPDRRYVEKRSDRHRTDKYRAYMDKYEKRQNNRLKKDNNYCNEFSKKAYDLREKIVHRDEMKVSGRSEYENYKNNTLDRDCKRGAHEYPSSEKSRSSSKGSSNGKAFDKRRSRRAKSSDRLAAAKTSVESSKERESMRTRSKDPKRNVVDQKGHDFEPKLEKSSRTSSEKEATNKHLASTTLLPDGLSPVSESDGIPEEINKNCKAARTKSKDLKSMILEKKDGDSELKSQAPSRTSSEEEVTNKELASCLPVANNLALKLKSDEIPDEQKGLHTVNTESVTATLQSVLNHVDNPGKWISSLLENNAEVPSIPPEILAPVDIGSRSFREEKIENIEKFIQDYQDDENLYCRIAKADTEELDCGNKSCNSTSSILDTLSMDIEVVSDNSLISEQLLLESLSTYVKKINPPLPPLPPPYEMKQPPLPPISPSDEIKQQSVPPLPSLNEKQQAPPPFSSADEKKQALPTILPPDEIKQQSLSPLSSLDKKQEAPPSFPSANEKKQALPPLPSPDEKNQNSQPLPSPDRKQQPLPPFPDTENQALPPLSSSNEKPQPLSPPPPPPPDPEKKTEKKSLSLQSTLEVETKALLSALPVPSEKDNLPLSLLPTPSEKTGPSLSQPQAPIDEIIDISLTKEIFENKLEPEKAGTEKVTSKQINRRHRIPCIPIISKYSRKKRDMVLTDSAASQCIVRSDSSSDPETNNNANVEIKVPQIFTEELKATLKPIKSSEFDNVLPEKGNNNPNSKIQSPEKLVEASNNSTSESASRIESETTNTIPELRETEKMESLSKIVLPAHPGNEISNLEKELENNAEESHPKLQSKEEGASPNMQNQVPSSQVEKPIFPKPVETRGTRSALKTIGPGSSAEGLSILSSRKRHLPKEKENQSKQVTKQCKIMLVARRRKPVHLEDSCIATTLVPSVQDTNCNSSSKNNNVKNTSLNGEKPNLAEPVVESSSKGRKRRSTDK